jgi:hypothetical protein
MRVLIMRFILIFLILAPGIASADSLWLVRNGKKDVGMGCAPLGGTLEEFIETGTLNGSDMRLIPSGNEHIKIIEANKPPNSSWIIADSEDLCESMVSYLQKEKAKVQPTNP